MSSPRERQRVTATIGTEFQIARGDTAVIEGASIRVVFDSVTQDSRCPSDPGVNCVWEGEAVIRLAADSAGKTGVVEPSTSDRRPAAEIFGLRFELRGIAPAASTRGPVPQDDYMATLHASVAPQKQGP